MKVVLSTSPHIKHSTVLEADFEARSDMMYTFAPLGLLMLASCMRNALQITPEIFDLNGKINEILELRQPAFYDVLASSILSHEPDVIGFMSECDSYHHVLQICRHIKKINPEVSIVLGGPHASAVAEETMKTWDCVDFVVVGEGEVTLVELIRSFLSGDEKPVAGTYYRDKAGNPARAGERHLVDSLDELPFPAYDLYSPGAGEELFIEVGRGCPFKCTFCSTAPFWQRKNRVKSAGRILEELLYLKSLFNVKRVHFTHDLFTANKKWVKEVCHALIEAKLDIKWTCSSRIDTVSDSLLDLMASAGCDAIFFGIESGSDRVLKLIEKHISREETLKTIALCEKHKIKPNAGLIVGFPFEDEESINDTFDMYLSVLKAGTKPVHLFSYCPFVQSTLYQAEAELECTGNFLDIPLAPALEESNRRLISNDRVLFGSYFKPKLSDISFLKPGMLSAVDEFALLVDSISIPAMLMAEAVGGMKHLFLKWVSYIHDTNVRLKQKEYRLYFGSPVNFCSFLIGIYQDNPMDAHAYLPSLIELYKKNFQISSTLSLARPLSMATYKSKTLPESMSVLNLDQKVSSTSLIDYLEIDYDVTDLLSHTVLPESYQAEEKKTNLIWQYTDDRTVALLRVNDFILNILKKTQTSTCSINEIIADWTMQASHNPEELDYEDLLTDIQAATETHLIKLNQV